jgi:MFS family permease
VICNLLGAIVIALFPNFYGFVIAAVFSALYWSFWSGTGQAFLAENLTLLQRNREFGRVIGGFMFYEQLAAFGTPFFTSLVLYSYGDIGFRILAVIDVLQIVLTCASNFDVIDHK